MPVLRHGLLSGGDLIELTTAWVSFAADITLDPDGIAIDYPGIARRL